MSQTWFFMTPQQLFNMLETLQFRHGFVVTLRRYQPPGESGPSGFEVVTLRDGIADYYNGEGFSEVYLTQSVLPRHSTDWDFVSLARSELLTIEGGRLRGHILETATARVWTRPSDATSLYRTLQRYLRQHCRHTMRCKGSIYRHMYYHPDVIRLSLRDGITENDNEFFPVTTAVEHEPVA